MVPEDLPASRPKPTVAQLGVDLAGLQWQRSGVGDGSFEVAFVRRGIGQCGGASADWVLLRVVGDPAGRVLVFDQIEWACFLDGVRGGEFDPGAAASRKPGPARLVPARPGLAGSSGHRRVGGTAQRGTGRWPCPARPDQSSNWCA